MSLLGNLKKGLLFIVSGPSGSGKTTLVNRLLAEYPVVRKSVSYTTRAPRPQEVHGHDYFFVTKEQFCEKKAGGHFLETITLFGAEYGTCRDNITAELQAGHHLILVIDPEGAGAVKAQMEATSIFIMPPSLDTLAHRLRGRGTEDEAELLQRHGHALADIGHADKYDYRVVNEQVETAYIALCAILIAEEHKTIHIKRDSCNYS